MRVDYRCTYCLAMHNRDARARGERQTRLDTVAAWREAPYYRLAVGLRSDVTSLDGLDLPDGADGSRSA